VKILFVGDIFGSPGRRIVADHVEDIIRANQIDLAIANGHVQDNVSQIRPGSTYPQPPLLQRNQGNGRFEDVTNIAGSDFRIPRVGRGLCWADYDDDGWPDLLVANDSVPNYLYHNNHNGTFTDVGLLAGVALSGEGLELGNMGVDFGDYVHSGRLSFFVTHFEEQPNSLYRNMGTKGFDDVSWTSGVGQPSYPYVGWGTAFFDMDNDTWLDLLVANGRTFCVAIGEAGFLGSLAPDAVKIEVPASPDALSRHDAREFCENGAASHQKANVEC